MCSKPCPHLGPPIESRDGITLMVKCGCKRQELREVYHAAHECEHPENPHGRCLPTLDLRTDEERQKWAERKPESDLYWLCRGCEYRTTARP